MLILDNFINPHEFIEITSFEECESVPSSAYALIKIDIWQDDLVAGINKGLIELAKKLQEEGVKYAVLIVSMNEYYEPKKINLALSIFSQLGASYCIFRDASNALFAQKFANYYLMDMKILTLVESCKEISTLSLIEYNTNSGDCMGIDGVVLREIIKFKR